MATVPTMLKLPAGTIGMLDEGSRRRWHVELSAFALAEVPVTSELYRAHMPEFGLESDVGSDCPVVQVSWQDALVFCNRLSEHEGLTPCYTFDPDPERIDTRCDPQADGFRLPTEAEWEYACRAGSTAPRYGELDAIAWHAGNSGEQIHPVGQKQANAWGLHDMVGNVWEWVWDRFDDGRVYGGYRVFRGGGWLDQARACRASCRRKSHPSFRIDDLGFRLAQSI